MVYILMIYKIRNSGYGLYFKIYKMRSSGNGLNVNDL